MVSISHLTTNGSKLAATTSGIYSQKVYMFTGASCQAASYTVSAFLFIACIAKAPTAHRMNAILTLMFLVTSVHAIGHLQFYREAIIEHGDDPGYSARLDTPYHILNNLFLVLSAVLADILMIWRCYIFWDKRISIIILPSIMTLTMFGFTIPWLTKIAHNDSKGFIAFGLAIIPVSAATNVIVTCLIAYRLITRLSTKLIRVPHHPILRLYRHVIGILVESAAMFAAIGVIAVTTAAVGSPSEQIFISLYSAMPSISTYLIVLRIRFGLAYNNSGVSSSIVFARKRVITSSTARSTPRSKLTTVYLGALDSMGELYDSSNSMEINSLDCYSKSHKDLEEKGQV